MSDKLHSKRYPEDERLEQVREDADRRMTRAEWEHEDSLARQAYNKKHEQVREDRKRSEREKRKHQHRDWKKNFKWVALAATVLIVVFLIGYIPRHEIREKADADARRRAEENPEVEVMQVRRSTRPGELTVPGTTAPLTEAFIYARANGYVSHRYVDIGDHVKKGQLLALIDAPDLDQQVDQAREQLRQAEAQEKQQEAQLALAKVTWDRWKVLVEKGVFSRQDGDQREANYLAQVSVVVSEQRNVESYRANLRRVIALQSYERVTAPFDGVVTQRNADIGALVGTSGSASTAPMNSPSEPAGGSANEATTNTSGQNGTVNQAATPTTGSAQGGPIFAIAQNDKLRILVSVPEGYAVDIRTGMQAKVYLQERPNQPIFGTVERTAGSVDQNTRTLLAEVDIDNTNGKLYPGMYAVVTFVQERGISPITIPGDAIVVRNDKTAVAVVRNQKIQILTVEIGRDYGPSVEILNGLQEGDWVVTDVTDDVQQGKQVRPHVSATTGQETNPQGNSPQTEKAPDSGPSQYGDQSITNAASESTNQQGKKGQGSNLQSSRQQSGKH